MQKAGNGIETTKFPYWCQIAELRQNGKICGSITKWYGRLFRHLLEIVSCSKSHFVFQIENELLSYAFGIISDYIPLDLSEKLSTHLGLEKLKAAAPGKRKSLIELENNTLKRVKSEEDFSSANIDTMSPPTSGSPLATVHEKKVSAKEKQLAKAASGTKSISSFFSKK